MRARGQLDFLQFYVHKLTLAGVIVSFVSLVVSTYRISSLSDLNTTELGKQALRGNFFSGLPTSGYG